MKLKRCFKVICAIIILFNITFIFSNYVTAYDYKSELEAGWTKNTYGTVEDNTKKIMGSLITIIRVVGVGMSIIMLMYVAIKYMSAAPEGKAEFKKSAIAFTTGAVILFATSQILAIIADFAVKNLTTT